MNADGEANTGFADEEGIPFAGVGPGDPDLLTVAGRKLVEDADLVVHVRSLVNSELLDKFCADVERVNNVGKDPGELTPLMADAYKLGRTVVKLHSDDPAICGVALEQIDALAEAGVPSYLVPGVTSAFAMSATLRTQLTLNEVSNHVVFTRPRGRTLLVKEDHISDFVGFGDTTVCIYLGTHAVSEMMDRLLNEGHDPDTPVVAVYRASWPNEDIVEGTIETIGKRIEDAGYRASAFVIIGEAVSGSVYERSSLYGDWVRGDDVPSDEPDTET